MPEIEFVKVNDTTFKTVELKTEEKVYTLDRLYEIKQHFEVLIAENQKELDKVNEAIATAIGLGVKTAKQVAEAQVEEL